MKFQNGTYEVQIKEIASSEDDDLTIVGYIVGNEVNKNDLYVSPQILEASAHYFVGRPLRILPNPLTLKPTGHGFDRTTGKFSKDVKNIGTIVSSSFVSVASDESVEEYFPEDTFDNTKDYRIMFTAKMWKEYLPELADIILKLHEEGNLRFSFEAKISYETSEDNIRIATAFKGIGISIVENPAFDGAKSIFVAEQEEKKGEQEMDYEAEYNKIKPLYDTVVAENTTLTAKVSEVEGKVATLETELASANTELATKVTEVKTKETEIAELTPFKTQFEDAQKETKGKARRDQLTSFTEDITKTDVELAEMSELDFSKYALEMATNSVKSGALRLGNYSSAKEEKKDIETLKKFTA